MMINDCEVIKGYLNENAAVLRKQEPEVYRSMVVLLHDHALLEQEVFQLEEVIKSKEREIQQWEKRYNDALRQSAVTAQPSSSGQAATGQKLVTAFKTIQESTDPAKPGKPMGRLSNCENSIMELLEKGGEMKLSEITKALPAHNGPEIESAIERLQLRGRVARQIVEGVARYGVPQVGAAS